MRTEEMQETAKLFVDAGGQAIVSKVSGFEHHSSEVTGSNYRQKEDAGFEKADRIHTTDLKAQGEGEMHVLFQDKLVRLKGFYANPEGSVEKGKLRLSANHFIKVPRPNPSEIELSQNIPILIEKFCSPDFPSKLQEEIQISMKNLEELFKQNDEIALAVNTLEALQVAKRPLLEAGCACVARIYTPMQKVFTNITNTISNAYEKKTQESNGPTLDEFELEQERRRRRLQEAERGFMDNDDPFANPVRNRMTDFPSKETPKKPFSQAQRKPSTMDTRVRHGAIVDDRDFRSASDSHASSESIIRSLAAFNFDDEDNISPDEIERRLEKEIGKARRERMSDDNMNARVSDFERAARGGGVIKEDPSKFFEDDDEEEEEIEIEDEIPTNTNKDNLVYGFLDNLLGDDEDNDGFDDDEDEGEGGKKK